MNDPRLIESNSPTKPLYMLIKVDVDPLIVYNNPKAHTYAENHCCLLYTSDAADDA